MDFEIYCDESGQEKFKNPRPGSHYTLIGSLWIKAEMREQLKSQLRQIRLNFDLHGEFKWKNVSPSRLDFYREVIKFFFTNDIRFRVLILRSDEMNAVKFHASDNELMFYKFYYQLLHHWILDFNHYRIFLDTRTNRLNNRLKTLQSCLNASNLMSLVTIQALPSTQVDLIQVADVLIGAVSYKMHGHQTSAAKLKIISDIERFLKRPIQPTSKFEEKFNVFRFRSEGGW